MIIKLNFFFRIVLAEMTKQRKNHYNNWLMIVSMGLWPLLEFTTIYYSLIPFINSKILLERFRNYAEISPFFFLVVGYLGFSFFFSMVQSAWSLSNERVYGTFSNIFLSPANRIAVLIGNAFSAILESTWAMVVLTTLSVLLLEGFTRIHWTIYILGMLLLLFSSIIWGIFLNSLFLTARESIYYFYIFQGPVELFSGTRIPIKVFPRWAESLSYLFPLTFCLNFIRESAKEMVSMMVLLSSTLKVFMISSLLIILTIILLKLGEKNLKVNGSFNFY